jgi:glycerol-3-phosphate O-acyltransferase
VAETPVAPTKIRFENLPAVPGPLSHFEAARPQILQDVVKRGLEDFSKASAEMLLGEAVYQERARVRRMRANIFTRGRKKADQELLSRMQRGLLSSPAEVDRKRLLEKMITHYSEEIGGHFNPKVYDFTTQIVPYGFSWLLNAASVQRFLPWGMTQSLQSRLRIQGEIDALQKLSKRGTILLVPTHQSNIDSILIGYIIHLMRLPPFSYGAGLNLFSNPVISYLMNNLGAYTVDRAKTNAIYKNTLKNYSTRILREGVHSIFFPGGGRSKSGAVESKLKLGLLGTALDAQIENYRIGKENPSVFIVPMVMSYHFVLEASSLIEDYLIEAGKHRFMLVDEEPWQFVKVLNFFWRLFSSQSGITVRVGRALDIFGNYVDENGRSIGPNGSTINPRHWLTTGGELKPVAQRDQEYTRELGGKIAERFHVENTTMTSHLVAFAFFEGLRTKYPELDLYRFLRLSLEQRSMPYADFLQIAEKHHKRITEEAQKGNLYLDEELKTTDTERWVKDGISQLGLFHGSAVLKAQDGVVYTEDLPLLYYYRNRLSGYGLSLLAGEYGSLYKAGKNDSKGFLA